MSQWINKDFKRPDPGLIEDLGRVPTSILSDCMNRFQSVDSSVRPLVLSWRFCGPAFTVQSMESCNWGSHQALSLAKAGDVLVIAARGGSMGAVWGHFMTTAAIKIGLAGVVIDGCVRDYSENRAETLPIFCRGISPGGPHKGWPCNLNIPVSFAGVAVLPGDIVIGDSDGVVVVPFTRGAEILDEAKVRIKTEKKWFNRLQEGENTKDILGIESERER